MSSFKPGFYFVLSSLFLCFLVFLFLTHLLLLSGNSFAFPLCVITCENSTGCTALHGAVGGEDDVQQGSRLLKWKSWFLKCMNIFLHKAIAHRPNLKCDPGVPKGRLISGGPRMCKHTPVHTDVCAARTLGCICTYERRTGHVCDTSETLST